MIANETTDKDLIFKVYKQLIQLNTRKQTTQSNSREKTQKDISPKKACRWLTCTWKDAQRCSLFEECKSKLQWAITSHWSEWPSSRSLQTINAGEGVEKREHSCTVGGNVNSLSRKTYLSNPSPYSLFSEHNRPSTSICWMNKGFFSCLV